MSSGQQQARAVTEGAGGFSFCSYRSFPAFAGRAPRPRLCREVRRTRCAGHPVPLLHAFMQSTKCAQLPSQRVDACGLCAFLFGLASEASLSMTKGTASSLLPPATPLPARRLHAGVVDLIALLAPAAGHRACWGVCGCGVHGCQLTTPMASLRVTVPPPCHTTGG